MSEENAEIETKSKGGCLKFALILFAIVLIGIGGFVYLTDKGMSMAKGTISKVVTAFRPINVVECFHDYCETQISGNEGNILEVATGEETVELSRESTLKMFNKAVPFGTIKSKIIIPATFRYHIDLNGQWDLIEDGNRLHVIAPSLQPSLPIAFDTAKMQKINSEGLSRFLAGSNMAELEKTITPELKTRATDPENIDRYGQEAKHSIAKFLQTWLIGEGLWKEGKYEEILVYFDGDLIDTANPATVPEIKLGIEQPPVLP